MSPNDREIADLLKKMLDSIERPEVTNLPLLKVEIEQMIDRVNRKIRHGPVYA